MAIYVRNQDGEMEPYKIVGLKGEDGITPNISIGTVTTLEAGEQATVTREGTNENPIFNFGIPKGESGTNSSNNASIDDTVIATNKTWSSSKIEDFIHTNDNVIWSTVQRENLSVDYTKEGYLREVEIWGNTVQNEEDLSNIQHLGVWNKENNKYEIELGVNNGVLWTGNFDFNVAPNWETSDLIDGGGSYGASDFIEIKEGMKLEQKHVNHYFFFDRYKKPITQIRNFEATAPKKSKYVRIAQYNVSGQRDEYMRIKGATDITKKEYKATLLLPCQLMKVGTISDRLYWDSNKGRYIIEKNIFKYSFVGLDIISKAQNDNTTFHFGIDNVAMNPIFDDGGLSYHPIGICNKGLCQSPYNIYWNNHGKNVFGAGPNRNNKTVSFAGRIRKDEGVDDITTAKQWLKDNDVYCYYRLATPQLIETDIIEQILLPCYKDKTHLFVIGGIDGSIKTKAPIDGGKAIQSLSAQNTALTLENEEIKATNKEQDELINTTMLATDEMYMMLEPLLAETLSERSTSKMVDMYVAMVKRELKKIEQVPEKYREQVDNIINNKQ